MNLKPELVSTLTNLGVTDQELAILESRMLSSVTGLQASIVALTAQIDNLTQQRLTLQQQLVLAQATADKLSVPPDPAPTA